MFLHALGEKSSLKLGKRSISEFHSLDNGLHGLVAAGVAVEDPGAGVDPQVDDEGTGVLGQEDGSPPDLRPAVLEVEDPVVLDPEVTEHLFVLDELALGLEPELLAVDVAVLLLLLADLALDVADRARLGHLRQFCTYLVALKS